MRIRPWGVTLLVTCASVAWAEESEPPKEEARQVTPLQSREVIERLKTIRAQLLLEQEYNRLLEARLQRQELEAKLAHGGSGSPRSASTASAAAAGAPANVPKPGPLVGPPPKLEAPTTNLIVKMVTTAPFKEAIVVYKQRVYTVRPGDNLGDCQIRDINEAGVVTSGACGGGAMTLK